LGAAQEGMTLGKPVIISEQPSLREYFYKGTVFVEHTRESLVKAIREVQSNSDHLSRDMVAMRDEHAERWNATFKSLQTLVGQ
jgi:hypothetical protein